jgi:hypothetical protein
MLLWAALLGAASCGVGCGSTDSGGGSGTLFVTAEANGRPDSTRIRVTLQQRGNPVVGANVVVVHVENDVSINLEGVGSSGRGSEFKYEGTFNRYARTLALKITSGEDALDARLQGPAPHVITRPPNDVIVRRKEFEFLDVRWEADGSADAATVTVSDLEPMELEGDPFEVQIPLGGLRNGTHQVEVRRETSVPLTGGVEGSVMRTRYTVDNRFTIEG